MRDEEDIQQALELATVNVREKIVMTDKGLLNSVEARAVEILAKEMTRQELRKIKVTASQHNRLA